MTDHYDESGGHARYVEEQRYTDEQRRKHLEPQLQVPLALRELGNRAQKLVAELNALSTEYPGVISLRIDAKDVLRVRLILEL